VPHRDQHIAYQHRVIGRSTFPRTSLGGNKLDHLCNHVVWIQPSFRLCTKTVRDLSDHGAGSKLRDVIDPLNAASTMVSLKPVRNGPGLIVWT
jgi:hypothetical protein